MCDVILFAFVAGLHFITSVCLLVYTFAAGMARFDSGAPAGWLKHSRDALGSVVGSPFDCA
jgi:hypothetical protein